MTLINALPTKILPNKPSVGVAPMEPTEAMELLKKHVKLMQRGSLKNVKILSIDRSIVYKYILNRYFIMTKLLTFSRCW